jgi:hypothetical protein
MNFEYYIDQVWTSNLALPVALTVLVIIMILIRNWRKLRHHWFEWSTRRCLNQIGIRQIKNFIYFDEIDGHFKIDRLVKLHDSILLIAFKPYSGNIYCADSIPEWTQVVGQKSFKFVNPLFELENQVTAMKNLIPNVPVRGVLFFDHCARFPKGHPEQVVNPDIIPDYFMRSLCPEPSTAIEKAWDMLIRLPGQANQAALLQK